MFSVYENGQKVGPEISSFIEAAEYANWYLGRFGAIGLSDAFKLNVPYRYNNGKDLIVIREVKTESAAV